MEMAGALVFENIAVLLKNCRFAVPYIKAKRLWKMPKGLTIMILEQRRKKGLQKFKKS